MGPGLFGLYLCGASRVQGRARPNAWQVFMACRPPCAQHVMHLMLHPLQYLSTTTPLQQRCTPCEAQHAAISAHTRQHPHQLPRTSTCTAACWELGDESRA
jgi:hypothetical protein